MEQDTYDPSAAARELVSAVVNKNPDIDARDIRVEIDPKTNELTASVLTNLGEADE